MLTAKHSGLTAMEVLEPLDASKDSTADTSEDDYVSVRGQGKTLGLETNSGSSVSGDAGRLKPACLWYGNAGLFR